MRFWIFLLSFSPVLHVTLANWQRFRFEFHLRSSPDLHLVGIVDQLITSLLATPCWRDPTRSKQLSTVAILGFQFGLYHAVAPLSSLRSISLASLFAIISFFCWSDLQILREQAAFSFVVLCIIMLNYLQRTYLPTCPHSTNLRTCLPWLFTLFVLILYPLNLLTANFFCFSRPQNLASSHKKWYRAAKYS